MNPFCKVEVYDGSGANANAKQGERFAGVDASALKGCNAVLLCGASVAEAERINDVCREVGAAFFRGDCRATSAEFFVDLGESFAYVVSSSSSSSSKGDGGGEASDPERKRETMSFVPLRTALSSKWSAMGDGRKGGVRRVNKLAAAHLMCAAFEREHGRAPTSVDDLKSLTEKISTAESANGVKPGWLPPAVVEDYLGFGEEEEEGNFVAYEMPAVAAVVGGILGQELLRAVTGKGEPVRNAFFFTMANSQGTIENIGCPA